MCAHPKSSSEVKNDWLVEAMHATVGSRNEEFGMRSSECGMVLTQMRSAEFGVRMSVHPKNTSLGEV